MRIAPGKGCLQHGQMLVCLWLAHLPSIYRLAAQQKCVIGLPLIAARGFPLVLAKLGLAQAA